MEGTSGWGLVASGANLVISELELSVTLLPPPQGGEEWLEVELKHQ